MTRWVDNRSADDHRGIDPPSRKPLCVICQRKRARIGDACRPCFDGLLVERGQARRQANRKVASGEAG